MTPLALIYLLLGVSVLYWPMTTLLFKRRVLDSQWLIMAALMAMSLSVIIYSTFFNSFLKGEFLLVIIFMVLSMFTPPLIQAAVVSLTESGDERSPLTRLGILVIPATVVVGLMAISVIIGGADMYRLWIERGTEGIAHRFYENSWRYNIIVAVHYYLYWFVIVVETTFVGIYSLIRINRYSRMLDEYYTANRVNRSDLIGTYLFVALNCFFVVASYVMYPFNSPRPVVAVAIGCTLQATGMFFIGYFAFRTPVYVENINKVRRRRTTNDLNNVEAIANKITDYVETQQHFRNPDLSVFLLAEKVDATESDVVNAIHHLHGDNFNDYINSVRIEFATHELLHSNFNINDPDHLERMAHHCGYLTTDAFNDAFNHVMQTSLDYWYESHH